MNSGKSASIQSSSTGGGSQGGGSREDQEFESHATETISPLLNPTTSLSTFPAYYHHQLLPNYQFDPPTFSQSIMINHNNNIITNNGSGDINNTLGMVWPNKYTSVQPSSINNTYSLSLDDPNNCTSSGVITRQQQINTCATQSHQLELPPLARSSAGSLNQQGGGRSNPKKRSRASRRTPTTVLTTDTNNFRQMVQEFTGIPASPFETAFAGRPRLDLFGGFGIQLPRDGDRVIPSNNGSSMLDVCSSTTMQPPHLMTPFPQKIIAPPYPINVPTITTTHSKNIIATTPSFHPRPPSDVTMDKFHVTGFRQGDPTTSLGSKPTDSLMNEFALGHNNVGSTTTTTSCATTRRSAIGRHEGGGNNSVTRHLAMVDKGAPLRNQGGVTKGEATVDSWICSSDS